MSSVIYKYLLSSVFQRTQSFRLIRSPSFFMKDGKYHDYITYSVYNYKGQNIFRMNTFSRFGHDENLPSIEHRIDHWSDVRINPGLDRAIVLKDKFWYYPDHMTHQLYDYVKSTDEWRKGKTIGDSDDFEYLLNSLVNVRNRNVNKDSMSDTEGESSSDNDT